MLRRIGDGSAFTKDFDLAAWLDLTPRQHSTSGKMQLRGMGQRGPGFYDKIILIYPRGISTRKIAGHLHDPYGIDVSSRLPRPSGTGGSNKIKIDEIVQGMADQSGE
jgi:hypothetical protein